MTNTLTRTFYDSPVGSLTLIGSTRGLRAILWPTERPGRVAFEDETVTGDHALLAATAQQLDGYFADERTEFDLPLDLEGTEFQRAVWAGLCAIPFGTTTSYGELALSLNKPGAARAVGAATGRNPVSIIVPCHRLVGANGALTGFAGGLDTKRWLLNHERDTHELQFDL